MYMRQPVKDEAKNAAHPAFNQSRLGITSLVGDAQRGKAKAGCCDARRERRSWPLARARSLIWPVAGLAPSSKKNEMKLFVFLPEVDRWCRHTRYLGGAKTECGNWKEPAPAGRQPARKAPSCSISLRVKRRWPVTPADPPPSSTSTRSYCSSFLFQLIFTSIRLYFNSFLLHFNDSQPLRGQSEG